MNLIQQRLKLVREILKESMIDGILVTNLTNIRWLSGFSGSYCRLLISAESSGFRNGFPLLDTGSCPSARF